MATTREVRRGERLLRLHQFVLLCSRRNIRSSIGNVEFASDQTGSDLGGHECRHELEFWRIWMTLPAKAPLAELDVGITERSESPASAPIDRVSPSGADASRPVSSPGVTTTCD